MWLNTIKGPRKTLSQTNDEQMYKAFISMYTLGYLHSITLNFPRTSLYCVAESVHSTRVVHKNVC